MLLWWSWWLLHVTACDFVIFFTRDIWLSYTIAKLDFQTLVWLLNCQHYSYSLHDIPWWITSDLPSFDIDFGEIKMKVLLRNEATVLCWNQVLIIIRNKTVVRHKKIASESSEYENLLSKEARNWAPQHVHVTVHVVDFIEFCTLPYVYFALREFSKFYIWYPHKVRRNLFKNHGMSKNTRI